MPRLGELDRLLTVARLGDHLESRVQRQGDPDPVPGEGMVVGHQDANDFAHAPPVSGS